MNPAASDKASAKGLSELPKGVNWVCLWTIEPSHHHEAQTRWKDLVHQSLISEMNYHHLVEVTDMFHRICSTIINGECGLMELSRKIHVFYVSGEGWFSDLTQCLVHGIIPQTFTKWALISMSTVVLFIAGERLAGPSFRPLSITSIICLLGGQLRVGW